MSKNLLKTAGVFAALVMGGFFAQAQSVSTPAGLPVFKDTGNPAADQARYESEKQKWYFTYFNENGQAKSAEQLGAEYDAQKLANAEKQTQQDLIDGYVARGMTREAATFLVNKKEIYNADPASYEAKAREAGLNNSSVKEISQAEFNTFPAEKQAHIQANPGMYRIVNSTK